MNLRPRHLAATLTMGAGLLALSAAPASAHVFGDITETPAGGYSAITLTVPHGCDESPTKSIAIQIPEGVTGISPMVHPGWTIESETETLPEPLDDGEGGQITERTSVVTFTAEPGNELPVELRDDFTIGFKAPDTPDEWIFFKTIQSCVEGQTDWVTEYTGEGEEPEAPAPAVLVVASEGDGHGGGDEEEATETTVAESDTDSSAAASTGDSDSDSSNGLAIAGLVAGLAGLGMGGVALAKTRS